MRTHIPTIRYAGVQGSFWMGFCICFSYASMFLLSRGYTNSQIGLIIAVAGIISSILQPLVAGLADRSIKITLRMLILLLSVIMILFAALLYFPGLHFLWNAVFYIVLLATLQMLTPLVNAVGMEWNNKGIFVDFGLARGIGSVSYAGISFCAGFLVEKYSTTLIPLLIIISYIILFLCSYFFKLPDNNYSDRNTEAAGSAAADNDDIITSETQNEASFFITYKKFFLLIVGFSLVFVSHNILNNFLFQIMSYHQGGSREMGIAAGIAAVLELPVMMSFTFMIRKASSGNLLKISCMFFTLKAFVTLLAPGIGWVYFAQIIQMGGYALSVPASVYYTNSLIRPKDRAKGQAYMTVTNTIGSVLGSPIGGIILDAYGVRALLFAATLVAFVGTIIVCFTTEKCNDTLHISY